MTRPKPPVCDVTSIREQVERLEGLSTSVHAVLSPHDMVANQSAYRRLIEIRRRLRAQRHVRVSNSAKDDLLSQMWESASDDDNFQTALSDVESMPELARTFIAEALRVEAVERGASPANAEADVKRIDTFVQAPDAVFAMRDPVLRYLPDPPGALESLKRTWALEVTSCVKVRNSEPIVLRIPFNDSDSPLALWVNLVPDTVNLDSKKPNVFSLCALLVDESDSGIVAWLVALWLPLQLSVDSFYGKDELLEIMDAHSLAMNKAWKALHGEYLADSDFDEVHTALGDSDNPFRAPSVVCLPWVQVEADARGHRYAARIFSALVRASAEPMEYWAGAELTDADLEHGPPTDLLEVNPIRLFLCAIEGTPRAREFVRSHLRDSVDKDHNLNMPIQVPAELQRMALATYLRQIGAQARTFDVHVFNPEDYPAT